MTIEYAPLLPVQRELYAQPRDFSRFAAYLKTLTGGATNNVALPPLIGMNPMAREHCATRLDELLAVDADSIAAEALAQAARSHDDLPVSWKASLALYDDARGGWTNKTAIEYAGYIGAAAALRRAPWLTIVLWSSAPVSAHAIRGACIAGLTRAVHATRFGDPKTLSDILCQETAVYHALGAGPILPPDELDYVRDVLAPLLATPADSMPVIVAALFGDTAAVALGYPPLGVPDYAGLVLAAADAIVPGAISPASSR